MNKAKEKVLEEYLKFRSLKSHTERAIKDIEFHIKKFMLSSKKPLEEFDDSILLSYISKITPEYKTSALNTIKSSFIKNFVKWNFPDWSSRFRHLDKLCQTEKPECPYSPNDMISEEDFKKLIDHEEKYFWKAYFLTLFYGGCRPVEVCNLKWNDIEFEKDGAFLNIYSNKNKKSFLKFVPENVSNHLKKLEGNSSEYVFYNKRTKEPIGVKGAYWKLKTLSKKALGKSINLYLLRHSIATINYNKDNIKDDVVARLMGHSSSMKKTYQHNHRGKLKEQAKKIYLSPEEIPTERKNEYDLRIEFLETAVKELIKNEEFQEKELLVS